MFEVLLHNQVIKKLKKLDKLYLKKFVEILDTLEEDPYPWKSFDLKKIQGIEGVYRIRIGVYRIIYYIEKNRKRIHILKLEKRKKVYR